MVLLRKLIWLFELESEEVSRHDQTFVRAQIFLKTFCIFIESLSDVYPIFNNLLYQCSWITSFARKILRIANTLCFLSDNFEIFLPKKHMKAHERCSLHSKKKTCKLKEPIIQNHLLTALCSEMVKKDLRQMHY